MTYPLIEQAQPDAYTRLQADTKFADKAYVGVTPWDISKSYKWGQFVLYKGNMYRCLEATSGAWDPSKWDGLPAISLGQTICVSPGGRRYPESPLSGLMTDAFDTVGHALDWLVNNCSNAYTQIIVASGTINDTAWPIWRNGQVDIIGQASTGANKSTLVLANQPGSYPKDFRDILGFADIEIVGSNVTGSQAIYAIYIESHFALRNVKAINFSTIFAGVTGSMTIHPSTTFPSSPTEISVSCRRALQIIGNLAFSGDCTITGEISVSHGHCSINGTGTNVTINATTNSCLILTNVITADAWDGLVNKTLVLNGLSTESAAWFDNCPYVFMTGCCQYTVNSTYQPGAITFQNTDILFKNISGRCQIYTPNTGKIIRATQGSIFTNHGSTADWPLCYNGCSVLNESTTLYSSATN